MHRLKHAFVLSACLSGDVLNWAESLIDMRYEDTTQRFLEENQYMEVTLESINDGMQYLAKVTIGTGN